MTTTIITLIGLVLSGTLFIYIIDTFVNTRIKKKLSENEAPITIYILKAALFISSGLLLSEILNPFQTLMKVLPSFIAGHDLLLKGIMYYSLFLGILLLVYIIILWVSILMFGVITKGKNIFIETANNNLSDVLLFSAILMALIFAVKSGLIPLLDLFIPYPELPIYY